MKIRLYRTGYRLSGEDQFNVIIQRGGQFSRWSNVGHVWDATVSGAKIKTELLVRHNVAIKGLVAEWEVAL
jgi:hypothetical protein